MKKKLIRKIVGGLCCLAMIGSLLTGCGEKSSTSSENAEVENTSTSSSAATETTEDYDAVVKKISDILAPYTGTPEFTESSLEKVDAASVMAGKRVFIIPYDPTNKFSYNISKCEELILSAIGAEPFIYQGENSADGWSKGIEIAIAEGYDIIDLAGGVDVTLIEPAVQSAKEAGILVMDCHGADISDQFTDDYTVGADFYTACSLEIYYALDYAEKNLGGFENLNMLMVGCTGIPCDITMRRAYDDLSKEFEQYGCKFTIKEIAATDWDTKTQEEVQSALTADSEINFICAYYDNQLIRVIPALEQMGKTDIPTVSYDGSPNVIDYVKSGAITMDIGESVPWTAFHCVDCMIRALDGKEVPNDAGYALTFIDKDSVDGWLNPDTGKADYAHDGVQEVYINGYTDLWGFDVSTIDFSEIE